MSLSFVSNVPLDIRLDEYFNSFPDILLREFESLCDDPNKISSSNRFHLKNFLDKSQALIEEVGAIKGINLEIANPLLAEAIRIAKPTLDRAKPMLVKRKENKLLEQKLVRPKTPLASPVGSPIITFFPSPLDLSFDTTGSVTPSAQHSPNRSVKPLDVRIDEYMQSYFDFRLSLFESCCDDPSKITSENRTELRIFLSSSQTLIEDINTYRIRVGFDHPLGKKVKEAQPTLNRAQAMLEKLNTNKELEQKLSKTPTPASTPVGTPVFAPQFHLMLDLTKQRRLTPPTQYSPPRSVTPPQPSPKQESEPEPREDLFKMDM